MRSSWAYTFLCITVVVLGAAVSSDYVHRKRLFEERTACVGSLTRLRLSKSSYAAEYGLTNGAVIPDDVVWRENGILEHCLSGGRYSINPLGIDPSCSYTGVVRWAGRLWTHGLTNGSSQ